MLAQFFVTHRAIGGGGNVELQNSLASKLLPMRPDALKESPIYQRSAAAWATMVLYATDGPTYRLFCFQVAAEQLQVVVEPKVSRDFEPVCQLTWNGVRKALKKWKPKLDRAELSEDLKETPILKASTGFRVHLDTMARFAIVAGVVSLVLVAGAIVENWVSDTPGRVGMVLTAVPAVCYGAATLIAAAVYWRRYKLVWKKWA
jgi:hypothetical protein